MFASGREFLALSCSSPGGGYQFLGLHFEDGSCRLVSEPLVGRAQIYNRDELVSLWGPHGPDVTALLVEGFRQCREDLVDRLRGDFALCFWDKSQQTLHCCRDQLGGQVAYYCYQPNRFLAVASSPALLLQIPSVPFRLNHERVADFLVRQLEGIDKTSSFFQGIHRLQPGCWVTFRGGRLQFKRYWSLTGAAPPKSDSEAVEMFSEYLGRAVLSRIGDCTGLASMLSGGMDSTSIARIAFENEPNLKTLSVRRDSHWTCPESRAIVAAQEHYGQAAHSLTEQDIVTYLPQIHLVRQRLAEPFDFSMLLNALVYLKARELNCQVILDGVDADGVLDEGSYLGRLILRGKIGKAWREAQGLAHFWGPEFGVWTHLYSAVRFTLLPPIVKRGYRSLVPVTMESLMSAYLPTSLISRDFAESVHLGERLQRLQSHPGPNAWLPPEREAIQQLESPYLTVALERYARVAAACGVVARHPFADIDLMSFCVGLPPHLKLQNGWPKAILRKAMNGRLPEKVLWRVGKEHLGWLFSDLYLKKSEDDHLLLDIDDQVASFLDRDKVRRLQEGLRCGQLSDLDQELRQECIALMLWFKNQGQRPVLPPVRKVIERFLETGA